MIHSIHCLGCFLTNNCEVAIIGEVIDDNRVSLTLSTVEDHATTIDFWLSPSRDEPNFWFRLRKLPGYNPKPYEACTVDAETTKCVEPSPFNYDRE